MADLVNKVRVCGYLRENNLVADTRNGVGVVRGNVVVAVEENNFSPVDVRVDYYATAGTKSYDGLLKMLPDSAVSFKALKTQYPMMSDEEVKAKATKVDAIGALEENAFKGRDGDVVTSPRIKGFGLFVKEKEFIPYENIVATAYVMSLSEETDKEGGTTGRLIVNVCIPNCFKKRDGTEVKDGFVFKLVCSDPVASYLSTYCSPGSTLPFIARNSVKEVVSAPLAAGGTVVGVNNYIPTAVSVVQELEIIGVSANPIDYTESHGFNPAEIRDILATREVRLEKIKAESTVAAKPVVGIAGGPAFPTPAPAAPTAQANPFTPTPNNSATPNFSNIADITF